jgi:hypothetical protein
MKVTKYLALNIILIIISFISCNLNKNNIVKVTNSSPKFAGKKYVELEKLYDMNVTEISMFGKESTPNFDMVIDFDENNNMYILDRYECKI